MNYLEPYRLYSVKTIPVEALGLPSHLLKFWEHLHTSNVGLFLVGGAVRDYLLGFTSSDFDFCTPLSFDQLKPLVDLLGGELSLLNETLQVMQLKWGTEAYEIARLRVDGYYADSRHPTGVTFTDDLKCDYLRRDFKINAFYLTFEGDVLDFCLGMSDITHRTLTTVRHIETTLEEDGLRLLRGIRFATTIRLGLTPEFMQRASQLAHRILNISSDRRLNEIRGILESSYWHRGLQLLEGCDLLQTAYHMDPVSYQLHMTRDALDFALRFAQCLALQTKAGEAHLSDLTALYPLQRWERREIDAFIRAYGERARPVDVLYVYPGDVSRLKLFLEGFKDPVSEACLQYINSATEEGLPLSKEALLVEPKALLAMGWDGKDLKTLLYTLFLEVHAGVLVNVPYVLEPAAKNILMGQRLRGKL